MDRMTITFGEYDKDVFEFLQKQKNASSLVRHLVRNYMVGSNNTFGENNFSTNSMNNPKEEKIEVLENVVNLLVKSFVNQADSQSAEKKIENVVQANEVKEEQMEIPTQTNTPVQEVDKVVSDNIEALKTHKIKL